MRSELDELVATEARLDRQIAEARARAAELGDDARRRAAEDEVALEAELVAGRARIAREGEAAIAAAVRAIEDEARLAVARYESVAGERLAALAVRLAERVAGLPALFETANRFEALLGRLVDAVAREAHVRALGAALARTSRQLHTLEQRVAPELIGRIHAVTRALDERAREDQTRLRTLRASRARHT
jgi:vacuolar-type H+-ATPase subunit D/Vma8